MCIIKFSTQQHNEIYDTTNNLKIIISVRGGNFFCSVYMTGTLSLAISVFAANDLTLDFDIIMTSL